MEKKLFILLPFIFFLQGCPDKTNIESCSLIPIEPKYQTYVTGVESGRGTIYDFSLIIQCNVPPKIDSVWLNQKRIDFEVFKNQEKVNTLNTNDTVQIIVNYLQINNRPNAYPTIDGQNEITLFYSSANFDGQILVNNFKKHQSLINPN